MKRCGFVIALMPILMGCGIQPHPVASGGASKTLPNAVVVSQVAPVSQPGSPPKPITIQGEMAAKLYQDLQAMPRPNPTAIAICTANLALDYTLTFERDGKTTGYAKLNPAGCHAVTFDGEPRDGMSAAGQQLWQEFGVALRLTDDPHWRAVPGPYTPLEINPAKIVVTKNSVVKTITNAAILKKIVTEINQAAGRTNHGMLHCNAMTNDWYRIAVYYPQGSIRVFENHGGACQPLVDLQSHKSFLAGGALSDESIR